MNKESAEKIENTTDTALIEFWKEIGKAFPTVTGGEFPPDLTAEMSATMEKMVAAWLSYNDPTFNDSNESAADSDYTWANLPTTCPDFVSHPHRGCYQCREASASEQQGTTALAAALLDLGTSCDVHQTGGYTMCVHIKTGEKTWIYANAEGFAYYDDDQEGEFYEYGDDYQEQTPNQKAQKIRENMKAKNIQAINP